MSKPTSKRPSKSPSGGQPKASPTSLRFACSAVRSDPGLPLPGLLRGTTRSGASEVDPLLADVSVERVYDLAGAMRDAESAKQESLASEQPELLALEAEDGTTIFIRSDTLAETVARVRPEALRADGTVDFALFRDPNATNRGFGDVFWKLASVVRLPGGDGLLDEAKNLAREWARDKFGELIEDKVYDAGSVLGAKALMWKIESRLAGRPGLYRWQEKMLSASDLCERDDPRLRALAEGKPALVFIHGTASYTVGAFADLRADAEAWKKLEQRFTGGIFGYEHRTFSESPAENALALIDALPKGARVSLITHSRGGLVGDLLCLGQVDDKVIESYSIDTRDADDVEGLQREAQEERQRLRAIRDKLAAGQVKVERYVRVACPARGTRFLSENLDAALSDFLNLVQWGGGALVGAAASALGGPVAGQSFGKGASSCLGVLKRLVLEIADKRIDPRLLPGIAAMRTDSPLAAFLAHPGTHRRDDVRMAVIAGDTEFDGLGVSNLRRRIANLFCDWRLFDSQDNDLVVDTDSMYAGLGFRAGARYLYDQDDSVTHFNYFRNAPTADALHAWLHEDDPTRLAQFQPIAAAAKVPWAGRRARGVRRDGTTGPRPAVIVLPGVMGSHIKVKRGKALLGKYNRVWFDLDSLFLGQLSLIADPDRADASTDDLVESTYGDLCDHLAETHAVYRCPYDWRKPVRACAEALKALIEQAAKENPGQPIRLLAHSMGGLVARTLISQFPEAWKKVVDSGGRLVMLGTPNNGSHTMVHTLLGKDDSVRKLEKVDAVHNLQEILDIVAGFPGALSLLPRPGFMDTGSDPRIDTHTYYDAQGWDALQADNTDRWYGDGLAGKPAAKVLAGISQFWNAILPANSVPNIDRVAYVYGQGEKTACGVRRAPDGRLQLLFTPYGDGTVTWQSGRLDGLDERSWHMPVLHGDMADEEEFFPAIVELLEKGSTDKLARLPRERGEGAPNFVLEASPPVMPSEDELLRAFMGGGQGKRKPSRERRALRVGVRAGDLRYLDHPVICGHYFGDAITGAESALDEMLVGALAERERLGLYATDIGTSAIVLSPPKDKSLRLASRPGAVVVGLGHFTGQLSTRQVSETVRAAVLRFLLQLRDNHGCHPDEKIQLYSLLIGWNSTASISVAESVAAITRGVLEANRQFRDAVGKPGEQGLAVSDLDFIELYRDAAITAARAVQELPRKLESELKAMGARIEPDAVMADGEGAIDRLSAAGDMGHWSRLIVTDADANESTCPPECYQVQYKSPMPRDVLRRLCGQAGCQTDNGETADDGREAAPAKPMSDASAADMRYYPERLKYVFLSQRARAETVWQQRQPGLIEAIVGTQLRFPHYDAGLGHTLFQLMVPLDYKAAAREQARLLLVLDGYTANLPWELLHVDGEPLVLRMPVVRQLATARFRPTVRTASTNSACLIVNPSTAGFDKRFPSNKTELASLPEAEREGERVRDSLRDAGWNDIVLTPPGKEALDIFKTLYERPYRVLMIAAHGMFEAKARDGRAYSGVVLSDGLLLTAVEVGQMEVVPEVVFLNACHLGSINGGNAQPNRLAYSLARELIEMGVRCVVAAGWAVDDAAASTFAGKFFADLADGKTFGNALFEARKETWRQHPGCNTWGAYQAYGDPGFRLQAQLHHSGGAVSRRYVALDELLADLRARQASYKRVKGGAQAPDFAKQSQWVGQQLGRCPPEWAERPDVLQAIAALYGETGADGFEAARQAYRRAVQLEDKVGRVGVKSIEQLANLEARRGGKLVDKGEVEAGLALIDSGIRRMTALAESVAGDTVSELNVERAAILGSAYKLQAAALSRKPGVSWSKVKAALAESARAYRTAQTGDPAVTPYSTLNALPLAWLSGELDKGVAEAITLAHRCGEQARKTFETSKSFWDIVMSADADLLVWLFGGELIDPTPGGAPARAAAVLKRRYEESVHFLPQSAREWDSVVKQWRLLARFLHLRGKGDDAAKANELDALADEYDPNAGGNAKPETKRAPARKVVRAPAKATRKPRG